MLCLAVSAFNESLLSPLAVISCCNLMANGLRSLTVMTGRMTAISSDEHDTSGPDCLTDCCNCRGCALQHRPNTLIAWCSELDLSWQRKSSHCALLQTDGENAVLAALGSWVMCDEFGRLQHFYPLIGERSYLPASS